MPKYVNTKHLSGGAFVVRDNGRIFKRTGRILGPSKAKAARSGHQPNKSLVIEHDNIQKVLYTATCSGAKLGEQTIAPGGSLTLATSETDVQMRFSSTTPGDTGTLVLDDGSGTTCTVVLSVNGNADLVFDATSVGSGPHVLTHYPTRFTYFDCKNNDYELTFATRGSFVTNLKRRHIQAPPSWRPALPPLINPGQPPNYIPPAPNAAPQGGTHEPIPVVFGVTNGTPNPVTYPDDWSVYDDDFPVISESRLGMLKTYVLPSTCEMNFMPQTNTFYNFALTGADYNDIMNGGGLTLLKVYGAYIYDLNDNSVGPFSWLQLQLKAGEIMGVTGHSQHLADLDVNSNPLIVSIPGNGYDARSNKNNFPLVENGSPIDWNKYWSAPAGDNSTPGDVAVKYYGYFPPTTGKPYGAVYFTIVRTHGLPPTLYPGWS